MSRLLPRQLLLLLLPRLLFLLLFLMFQLLLLCCLLSPIRLPLCHLLFVMLKLLCNLLLLCRQLYRLPHLSVFRLMLFQLLFLVFLRLMPFLPHLVLSVASSPVAALRHYIPHRDFLTFDVANFVTVSIEKFRLHLDSYSALTDYVSSFQRNVLKKMSSSKKPLKRPPAKLLDSEGPPARKPTGPDRVK